MKGWVLLRALLQRAPAPGCSSWRWPVSSAFSYATDLFTAGQIFKTGIVLDVVGIGVLVLAAARFWELVGLV